MIQPQRNVGSRKVNVLATLLMHVVRWCMHFSVFVTLTKLVIGVMAKEASEQKEDIFGALMVGYLQLVSQKINWNFMDRQSNFLLRHDAKPAEIKVSEL